MKRVSSAHQSCVWKMGVCSGNRFENSHYFWNPVFWCSSSTETTHFSFKTRVSWWMWPAVTSASASVGIWSTNTLTNPQPSSSVPLSVPHRCFLSQIPKNKSLFNVSAMQWRSEETHCTSVCVCVAEEDNGDTELWLCRKNWFIPLPNYTERDKVRHILVAAALKYLLSHMFCSKTSWISYFTAPNTRVVPKATAGILIMPRRSAAARVSCEENMSS